MLLLRTKHLTLLSCHWLLLKLLRCKLLTLLHKLLLKLLWSKLLTLHEKLLWRHS